MLGNIYFVKMISSYFYCTGLMLNVQEFRSCDTCMNFVHKFVMPKFVPCYKNSVSFLTSHLYLPLSLIPNKLNT